MCYIRNVKDGLGRKKHVARLQGAAFGLGVASGYDAGMHVEYQRDKVSTALTHLTR